MVVGILINTTGEVLIAERPAHKFCPGLWEFPGGKVETNEAPFAALQREFQEEIGINIQQADPWFQFTHEYPDRTILLDNWLIKTYSGNPQGAEGQVIRWVVPQNLDQFTFPEGNKIIVSKLKNFNNKGRVD